jgi:hypothetical protein
VAVGLGLMAALAAGAVPDRSPALGVAVPAMGLLDDGTFLAERLLGSAADGSGHPDGVAEPTAADFEGFGLEEFAGTRSVAAALRRTGATRRDDDDMRLGVNVRGPGRGAATGPLAAELCSRIQRIDLAAGLRANPARITEGPACWEGRIGVANEHDGGRETLELRTTLGHWQRDGSLGVELGPRIERQIRKGTTFFVDGKAEARAVRAQDTGWWALPGTSADAAGMLGVTARTGIVR